MLLPRFVSKLLAVLRGNVAPPLIFVSVMLGVWLGLMPGWSGLHTALAVIVLVLNVHIGLFILALGFGKAMSLAAAPVLYHTGVWVHGHLAGLLSGLASDPGGGNHRFQPPGAGRRAGPGTDRRRGLRPRAGRLRLLLPPDHAQDQ